MFSSLITPFDVAARIDRLPTSTAAFLVNVFLALERESLAVTEDTEEQLLERGMQIIETLSYQSAFGTQLMGFIRSSQRRHRSYIDLATPRQLNQKFPIRLSLAA